MREIRKNVVDVLQYRLGSGDSLEICDIVVNSQRGVGVGSKMVDSIKALGANIIFAFCRASNVEAHKFYKKNGFVGTVIPRFYQDEDAIIFVYEANR